MRAQRIENKTQLNGLSGQTKRTGKVIGLSSVLAILMTVSSLAMASVEDMSSLDATSATKTAPKKPAPKKPSKPAPSEPSAPSDPSESAPSAGEPSAGGSGTIQAPSGVVFDTCFSPNAGCDQKLIKFISNAKSTLDIAIYSITHTGIAQAIIAAKNRGIRVRMVVDKSQAAGKSSETGTLTSSGITLKIGNFKGIMHDKFTIVDGAYLETGSYNYTANATDNNGENQLYLNDADVIQRYEANFNTMFADALAN